MKTIQKNMKMLFGLALLVLWGASAFAQIDGKKIAQNYSGAVVKILVWDPVLEQIYVELGEGVGGGYLGRGSGFIVSPDGYVFTNEHVADKCYYGYVIAKYEQGGKTVDGGILTYTPGLESKSAVKAIYYSGRPIPLIQVFTGTGPKDYEIYIAEVVSMGTTYDGAMLRIVSDINGNSVSGKKFATVPIGNSDKAQQGESICVYGYPAQVEGDMSIALRDMSTMTFGVHSGIDYVFNEDFGMIKTDASINGGNSGGPAFGEGLKVIGIATATGVKTNIGLLEGINGIYHIVEPFPDVLKKLTALGLTPPQYSGNKRVVLGKDKPALPKPFDEKTKPDDGLIAVSGTVKSADSGQPIKDAIVGLLQKQGEEFVIVAYAVTTANGSFVMDPKVPKGSYIFAAIADGYKDVEAKVDISADNNTFTVTMAKKR